MFSPAQISFIVQKTHLCRSLAQCCFNQCYAFFRSTLLLADIQDEIKIDPKLLKTLQTVGPFLVQHSAKLCNNFNKSCSTTTLLLHRYVNKLMYFFSHFQNYISIVTLERKKTRLILGFIGYIKCLKII